MNLDAAYWVGAVKRDAEGSYMQLQCLLCLMIKAGMWFARGVFWKLEPNKVRLCRHVEGRGSTLSRALIPLSRLSGSCTLGRDSKAEHQLVFPEIGRAHV